MQHFAYDAASSGLSMALNVIFDTKLPRKRKKRGRKKTQIISAYITHAI